MSTVLCTGPHSCPTCVTYEAALPSKGFTPLMIQALRSDMQLHVLAHTEATAYDILAPGRKPLTSAFSDLLAKLLLSTSQTQLLLQRLTVR